MMQEIKERRFWTPGAFSLLAVMAVGYLFGLARMITGLGSVTNLSDQYPWGIWIGVDVASGVALAAGGFTTAALINIFGQKKFHALERPALLTAWLGYTFVGVGLMFDLGRYYNIWHPALYWQGNSVLFEVGMCVMFYLNVLTIEFAPTILEGVISRNGDSNFVGRMATRFLQPLKTLHLMVCRVLPVFIIAGVVLSFMHQSSLGSLMLIAPTKLNSLWWTPILPILFLLSAVMVGFPMVIFESIIVSKSFGNKAEMELLTPLSKLIPWFLGLYALVKFGDLAYRWDMLDFFAYPTDTAALFVELGIGVAIPFVMLLQKSVRRSPFWLFIAVASIVVGVLLNRINVFVTGFHPYFSEGGYFPSIGEISLTIGLIATIILLYRFFAYYLPVLHDDDEDKAKRDKECELRQRRTPLTAWIARGLAVMVMLSFVLLYAFAHHQGIETSVVNPRTVAIYGADSLELNKHDPISIPTQLSFSAETMPKVIVIDRQHTNEQINDYDPVRFMHKAHASRYDGNCSICHHRVKRDEKDRIGEELKFSDMDDRKPESCVACHQNPNEADYPTRLGLKGAYHAQCIGCHEETHSDNAPTDCTSCHSKRTPDHTSFIHFTGKPKPQAITARCLECHEQVGQDILKTPHWKWEGASPNIKGHEHRTDLGKKNILNNYCIHVKSNEARCSQCHIGYGWTDDSFDFNDPTNIDCLVCHDTTGTYAKAAPNGGMPKDSVNIVKVAQNVGKTSRQTCGSCHFFGGGGANVKHGDLEPALIDPEDDFDVHMGKNNMTCQDCHKTQKHRIPGQCMAIPASEGRVSCEQCHGDKPHNMNLTLGYHLDMHSKTVACQTCHIPHFAKETPTKLSWDWSTAGQDIVAKKDQYGMPTFMKKKGSFVWGMNVDPCITWYDGTHTRYLLGDKVENPDEPTMLNAPVGSIENPNAKLFPFKCYSAVIPMDKENQIFAVPNLWKGFWKDFNWEKSLKIGMEQYGLEFSGKVGFGKANMFWGINHEVVPASKALRCADCHQKQAVTCSRCHGEAPVLETDINEIEDMPDDSYHRRGVSCAACHDDAPEVEDPSIIDPIYEESKANFKRSDFERMGYENDPALIGGRSHHYNK